MNIVKSLGFLPPTSQSKYRTEFVMVECPVCATLFKAQKRSIVSGHTKSCGCLKKDGSRFVTTKPLRDAQPRLYRIWKNMKSRCNNPRIPLAKNYVLRGITYAKEWDDFSVFYNWALSTGYKDGLTIDRIDVDGRYGPDNCRWATMKQQAENTRLLRSSNTSGFRGVNKKGGKYSARVVHDGARVYLGAYATPDEAAIVRDNYVRQSGLSLPLNFSNRA
jgi:hypothetical protein